MPVLTSQARKAPAKASGGAARKKKLARSPRRSVRTRALPGWAVPVLAVCGVVTAVTGVGVFAWSSGWISEQTARIEDGFAGMAAASGLVVKSVMVDGRQQTSDTALTRALGVRPEMPIFAVDLPTAQARVAALPWVKDVVIERRLPDTLYVHVTERTPMAVWQQDGRLVVVDSTGAELTPDYQQFTNLPLIVGQDAPQTAGALLPLLDAVPQIRKRLYAAIRVGGRRWDLRLDNGVDIRLPEEGVAMALKQAANLDQVDKLFDRDIVAIDLRLPDRLVIQTSETAAKAMKEPVPRPAGI
jgi:cell division protein FtsQ